MYDPGQGIQVVERPSLERRKLLAYVRGILDGQETLDHGRLQMMLDAERKGRR
jgi:hypothetical protein